MKATASSKPRNSRGARRWTHHQRRQVALQSDWFTSTCSNVAGLTDDELEAMKILIKGCMGGETQLCIETSAQKYNEGEYQDAVPLFEQACRSQDLYSCLYLGYMYRAGLGVTQDYVRTRELWQQGCDGGNLQGCSDLGFLYENGLGGTLGYDPARVLYRQACEGPKPRGPS